MLQKRAVGKTGIRVSAVALGCWPIAGMTSPDVSERDSISTIQACMDVGINFLDTAYAYGAQGESEQLIRAALGERRDEVVIATKGGIHWKENGERVFDARPETLRRELDESLRRLGTDRVELLYLHAPDERTPIADSAAGLMKLVEAGKARAVGVSNLSRDQLVEFHQVCPISAFQPPYNMLQREIEQDTLPWCINHQISVMVYWPLMKGLLAGKLRRDHVFPPSDGRHKYPMFQGEEWQRNLDFVDDLRDIADSRESPSPSWWSIGRSIDQESLQRYAVPSDPSRSARQQPHLAGKSTQPHAIGLMRQFNDEARRRPDPQSRVTTAAL